MVLFFPEREDGWEAWERQDRKKRARKRAERLASFKEHFGDLHASLRRACVQVRCASRNLVHSFDAKVAAHPLHCNGDSDHKRRVKSGSVNARLLSRVVNLQRHGYLKVDESNFEDGHASEDLEWPRLGKTQVSGGVTETLSEESVASTYQDCHRRPVCISAERF